MVDYAVIKQLFQVEQKQHPFHYLQESVHATIINAIISLQIQPGDHLNDGLIAKELHISRTPVRHALALLEQGGFLIKSKYDYVVINIDWNDVREVMYVRQAIEPTAAAILAKNLTPRKRSMLTVELATMKSSICDGKFLSLDVFANMELRFHKLIVTLSENQTLIAMYNSVEMSIMRSYHCFVYENTFKELSIYDEPASVAAKFYNTHALLVTIIESCNDKLAHDALQEHLELSMLQIPHAVDRKRTAATAKQYHW